MKELERGQEVIFEAIDNFTGELVERRGVIIDNAVAYIEDHPKLQSEYGGVTEGYIVKESYPSERINLITTTDIIKVC